MSDHHRNPTRPKARKPHKCAACWHRIDAGEIYVQQTGFYQGDAYRNRYHVECWDALCDSRCFEFTPGELDPPERLMQPRHDAGGEG